MPIGPPYPYGSKVHKAGAWVPKQKLVSKTNIPCPQEFLQVQRKFIQVHNNFQFSTHLVPPNPKKRPGPCTDPNKGYQGPKFMHLPLLLKEGNTYQEMEELWDPRLAAWLARLLTP